MVNCGQRRMAMRAMALLTGILIGPYQAHSQPLQGALAGRDMALKVCIYCNVVASNQEFLPSKDIRAPPFAEIANPPSFNIEEPRTFMLTTHQTGRSHSPCLA